MNDQLFGWTPPPAPDHPLIERAGAWPRVRAAHLELHPECAACGSLDGVEVHHEVPYHLDASKELDPENLISLCRPKGCHYLLGHLWNWALWNPDVRKDAAAFREKLEAARRRARELGCLPDSPPEAP